MRPDAATPTAPEVVDHGVLAAVLKQGALDPADGTQELRHGEEEQHGTYRIANSPWIASNHSAATIRPVSMLDARRVRTTVPSENAARTSTSASSSSSMVQTTSPLKTCDSPAHLAAHPGSSVYV